jgi:Uma2 family endonuclease
MHVRTRPTLYDQLEALPEGLNGEILNGQIHTQPRPSGRHGLAESSLIDELVGPFQKGRGGPGGWWIIGEPELHFIRDTEVDVPDLAGWRRERMPRIPEDQRFTVVPDWVCEILSDPFQVHGEQGPGDQDADLRRIRGDLCVAAGPRGTHPGGL